MSTIAPPPPTHLLEPAVDQKALVSYLFEIDLTKKVTKGDCLAILQKFGVERWFQKQDEFKAAEDIAASIENIEDKPENLEELTEALEAREVALKEFYDSSTGLRGRTTSIPLAFKGAIDVFFAPTRKLLDTQIGDLTVRIDGLLKKSNDAYVEGLAAGEIPSPPPQRLGNKKITYVPIYDPENSNIETMLGELPAHLFVVDEKAMADYIAARGFSIGSEVALKLGIAIRSGIKKRKATKGSAK